MPHSHHYMLPSTNQISDKAQTVMGVCACGNRKRHKPYWTGGTKEQYNQSHQNRQTPEQRQRAALRRLGYQLV